jgi:uncharacterized membrane protein YbhN (UPF0104 family)
MPSRIGRWAVMACSVALAATLLVVVLPRATGVSWIGTGDMVFDISPMRLTQLVAVWTAGLWLHTFVLRAALPGLRTHRAFALNLGGSSVSNVLPLGGAAGVGLNYAMLRSWGYSQVQISAFTAVSNLVVAVIKVLIALAGVVVLLASSSVTGLHVPLPHLGPTGVPVVVAVVTAVTAIARVTWRSKAAVSGRAAVRLSASEAWIAVRTGWRAMLLGGLGYPALQALLLWLCLQAMGGNVTVLAVLLTYAVERLLTLVPFTPGGVGVVETGASAVLVAFGVDPAAAVAGFLLFRMFSYLIEIPVGGLITACWLMRQRVRPS